MDWESRKTVESQIRPGVRYVLGRMSFGRRLELMRRIRDLAARLEHAKAGGDETSRVEASIVGAEIDRLYLEWGLEEVHGLEIDGMPASVQGLIDRGPEDLVIEVLQAIRNECGLSEAERKN